MVYTPKDVVLLGNILYLEQNIHHSQCLRGDVQCSQGTSDVRE